MDRNLSPRQVAEILSVPLSWVYTQATKHGLSSLKVGKYIRISERELEAWIERQKTGNQNRGEEG